MSRRVAPSAELDLVPVMNLVTILIPFLLVASGMAITVVETSMPMKGEGGSDPDAMPSIVVGSDAVSVVAADGTRAEFPCRGSCAGRDALDLTGLAEGLHRLRDADPTLDGARLVPDDSVSYEVIIALLDASREAGMPNVVMAAAPL